MTLPTQTSLSLSQIQTEFGGSNPISLSEYYAGGAYVPSGTIGYPGATPSATGPFPQVSIPSSGTISIANFFGAENVFTYTISANTSDVNITAAAMTTAGWNGTSKVRVSINSGVTISATTSTTAAFRLSGSFSGGVEIYNEGTIGGAAGVGGNGATLNGTTQAYTPATAGGAGGAAIAISSYTGPTVIISNYGYIRGAGGGGGGGRSTRYSWYDSSDPPQFNTVAMGGGGGGGGRQVSGTSAGGTGGATFNANALRPGSNGNTGSSTGAGTGGSGGVYGPYSGGNGGNGGEYGASGSSGTNGSGTEVYGSPGAGGSGGAAVTGYASASLTNYGSGAYSGSLVS